MKYALLLLALLLFFTGCAPDVQENTDRRNKITYIKDSRTGLCFAVLWGCFEPTITCVPCETLQGLDYIQNQEPPQ